MLKGTCDVISSDYYSELKWERYRRFCIRKSVEFSQFHSLSLHNKKTGGHFYRESIIKENNFYQKTDVPCSMKLEKWKNSNI